eukprot:scaffold50475_cov66-Phaeocystis_antarctica.AAC.8
MRNRSRRARLRARAQGRGRASYLIPGARKTLVRLGARQLRGLVAAWAGVRQEEQGAAYVVGVTARRLRRELALVGFTARRLRGCREVAAGDGRWRGTARGVAGGGSDQAARPDQRWRGSRRLHLAFLGESSKLLRVPPLRRVNRIQPSASSP